MIVVWPLAAHLAVRKRMPHDSAGFAVSSGSKVVGAFDVRDVVPVIGDRAPSARQGATRPLPWPGDRHCRRRVLRQLRRSCPRNPSRQGNQRRHARDRCPIRAGIHIGECEINDRKVAGIAVNIGARVASFAEQNDVIVSQTVHDLVVGSGITFHDCGAHELRGIPESGGSSPSQTAEELPTSVAAARQTPAPPPPDPLTAAASWRTARGLPGLPGTLSEAEQPGSPCGYRKRARPPRRRPRR